MSIPKFLPPGQTHTEFPGEHGRTSPMSIPAEVAPDRAAIMGERAPAPPAPESEAEVEADAWWTARLGPRR